MWWRGAQRSIVPILLVIARCLPHMLSSKANHWGSSKARKLLHREGGSKKIVQTDEQDARIPRKVRLPFCQKISYPDRKVTKSFSRMNILILFLWENFHFFPILRILLNAPLFLELHWSSFENGDHPSSLDNF